MKGLSKARTAFQRCPDSEPTPERPHFHTGRGRRANLSTDKLRKQSRATGGKAGAEGPRGP